MKPKPKTRRASSLEKRFLLFWKSCDGPALEQEYAFHPRRKWRADFAHLESKTLIELQGGIWIGGGHSTGTGVSRDAEKFMEASFLGWTVIPLTPDLITIPNVERLIELCRNRQQVGCWAIAQPKPTYPKSTQGT